MNYHLTPISSNKKTGPIAVSTSSAETCPPSCGLFNACYAKTGPQALHWRKVTSSLRGYPLSGFLEALNTLPKGSMFRHNASGDLPGIGESVDNDALQAIHDTVAKRRLVAWTYTHKKSATINKGAMTINLSADNASEADTLINRGFPVTCILPIEHETKRIKSSTTPGGHLVVTCPATIHENVSCHNCGNGLPLCARNERQFIIGFPAHGTSKRKANIIATVEVA